MSNIKLTKKIVYTGTITLKTGLHIGGTNAALNIGGPDKFVVRNPISNIPYIPGSSLKGKMRSLIETYHGCVDIDKEKKKDKDGNVIKDANGNDIEIIKGVKTSSKPDSISGRLFGVSADSKNKESLHYASRLIVRDSELITEIDNDLGVTNKPDFSNTDLPYTESKTEVAIDRVTAKANPRTFERVPAGAKFKLNMVLNVFENDDEKKLKETLTQAIELLHDDYLGGHGSRGYGQVQIDIIKTEEKTY
jgi:CRISPR-associated protein Csm3